MRLKQFTAITFPFVREFVAFAHVAMSTCNDNVVRAIGTAARKRDNVVNVKPLDFLAAPIAASLLSLILTLHIFFGVTALSVDFTRTAAVFGGSLIQVVSLWIVQYPSAFVAVYSDDILLAVDKIVLAFLLLVFSVVFPSVAGAIFPVGFMPTPDSGVFSVTVAGVIVLLLLLNPVGVLLSVCLFAHLALRTHTRLFLVGACEKLRSIGVFNAAFCAAVLGCIHSAPHCAGSYVVCSQGGMSAAFSGATLDYTSILPQKRAR